MTHGLGLVNGHTAWSFRIWDILERSRKAYIHIQSSKDANIGVVAWFKYHFRIQF
jgi:hypothetical protein